MNRLIHEWTHIDTPRGHPARNDAEFAFMMKWLLALAALAPVAALAILLATQVKP